LSDPKANKQPQPKTIVGARNSGKVTMMPGNVPTDDTIRERAYELYERRGREPGQDQQDWLRAEREFVQLER